MTRRGLDCTVLSIAVVRPVNVRRFRLFDGNRQAVGVHRHADPHVGRLGAGDHDAPRAG